jgi:dihydropteroate synthase
MGIVNVTPDSFSDGGRWTDTDAAVAHGVALVAQGADLLDVGGESTRPGAASVDVQEEIDRVVPVVGELARRVGVPVSADTSKAAVFREAAAAGAGILNDVTALTGDPDMAAVASEAGAALVLMHMQGTPRVMQKDPHYTCVVSEVAEHLALQRDVAVAAGVGRDRIVIDPGIGFGKTLAHNLELLGRLAELRGLGCPVLTGTSRKSFIGALLDAPVDARVFGTAASVAAAIAAGADIVRVHDVAEMRQVCRVSDAIAGGWQ